MTTKATSRGSRRSTSVVSEALLTAREVAERLGFAPGTVVDWFEAGKIPGFKVGGRLRFRWSEIESWLEERRPARSPCAERVRVLR